MSFTAFSDPLSQNFAVISMGEPVERNYNLREKNKPLIASVAPTYSSLYVILLLFMWYLYLCEVW